MPALTESVVEQAALAWLEGLGWSVLHGPEIAPETPAAALRSRRISGEVRVKDAHRFIARAV